MATTPALRAELDNLDQAHLDCRDLKHPWKVVGYYYEGTEVRRVVRCTRCTTTRTDMWKKSGDRIRSRYKHADGYLISGFGPIKPIDVRVAVLRRVKIYNSMDEMMNAVAKGRR